MKKKLLIEKQSQDFNNIKSFKELIKTMYKYFPNSSVSEKIIRKIIKTDFEIKHLTKNGFLNEETIINKDKKEDRYSIGGNSINLINSWKMEKLTYWIIGFTIISLITNIVLLLKSLEVF